MEISPEQFTDFEPPSAPEPPVRPVCSRCEDTHRVWSSAREQYEMCTSCPTPCQECRSGAYCQKTPCACGCHRKKPPARTKKVVTADGDEFILNHNSDWSGSVFLKTRKGMWAEGGTISINEIELPGELFLKVARDAVLEEVISSVETALDEVRTTMAELKSQR